MGTEDVAPHVGAWIEMHNNAWVTEPVYVVAPHVGAWIEITHVGYCGSVKGVAPHVGAWIEIQVPTPSVTRPAQAALPRAALWIASRAVTSC